MSGPTDVLLLADSAGSALGQFAFWDGVLVAGCALAVYLGMRARNSLVGGLVRSGVILAVWVFIFFVPLMFIGSLIGVAADNYDVSRGPEASSLEEER
ncbi:hypothetical protein [Corynebacterium suedekumii]|uniref:Uncharacterized protein n=1 Tax=Corynebacterium suedekumii TaxID=3049801 RepID=A0ABY8VLQ9_9CORY|nr:hypothetical protein [Corynebacterium suedekumii]WIM70590.1 hypothetical protein QP029_01755 [Corynebacterium suedekumii]